jgi:hypothetical protein
MEVKLFSVIGYKWHGIYRYLQRSGSMFENPSQAKV